MLGTSHVSNKRNVISPATSCVSSVSYLKAHSLVYMHSLCLSLSQMFLFSLFREKEKCQQPTLYEQFHPLTHWILFRSSNIFGKEYNCNCMFLRSCK